MGNVTITQLVNGTTADANVVDTNLNAIAAVINGGIDSTNITDGSIQATDLVTSIQPQGYLKSITTPFVVSGLTIATSGTLSSTIASGSAMINGKVVTVAGTPITVTLSKDTYVDIKDDGSVVQVPVANNATSGMTLTLNTDGTNALRIAKVVSSASAITQVLQGTFNTSPVAPNTLNWFGFDALGNAVYNTNPNNTLLGYVQITGNATAATSDTLVTSGTSLTTTVLVPFGRKVKVRAVGRDIFNSGTGNVQVSLWDGAVGGTEIARMIGAGVTAAVAVPVFCEAMVTPATGSKTYSVGIKGNSGGVTLEASSSNPAFLIIEAE